MDLSEYQAATKGVAFFDLSHHGKIGVTGPDSRTFLHNLCTQDVKSMAVGETREAFFTTTKARVVSHVWIIHREKDFFWIDMANGDAPKLVEYLNRYLISEHVEISDYTQHFQKLRVAGPEASSLLSAVPPDDEVTHGGWHFARCHSLLGLDCFDWFGAGPGVKLNQERWRGAGALPAGNETHRTLRIEAGLPEYGIDIDENRLAMEVNRPQAISYNKGCYLGQETIVMARDRGQVNRLLMGVKMEGSEPLPSGTKLFRANEEVGQVTSSTFSPRVNQVIALAYLRRGAWDVGTEVVTDGRVGVVCALPFVI